MELISLLTRDGVRLAGRWWSPSAAGDTAVVVVHGFTASMDDPAVALFAEALAADGHLVLTYDSRGHHRSEGLCTLGDRERFDVEAAVAAARRRAGRVVTVGASMGGIAVLRHAASDHTLAGVVTMSAPARWALPRNARAVLAAGLTRTALGRRFAARRLQVRISPEWSGPSSPEETTSEIRVPLAVIHGEDDRLIPPGEALRLSSAAQGPVRLELLRAMGHAFDPVAVPTVRATVDWTLATTAATTEP